jgi:hypothetical protein
VTRPIVPAETVIVQANVPIREMSRDQRQHALDVVLDQRPHYAGLQEWGEEKLLGAVVLRGYGHTRGRGGPPVLYDLDRTGLLWVHGRRLAGAEFVGHLAARKSRLPKSIATEAVYEDDEIGEVAHLNAHLTAEVQSGGVYRRDAGHRLRVARHKRELRRLARRVRHHVRHDRWVIVTVDGNFDGLQLPSLTSCWDGRKAEGTLEGPDGNLSARAVDIVFTPQRASTVRTIVTGSDHRAVVATYPKESR